MVSWPSRLSPPTTHVTVRSNLSDGTLSIVVATKGLVLVHTHMYSRFSLVHTVGRRCAAFCKKEA